MTPFFTLKKPQRQQDPGSLVHRDNKRTGNKVPTAGIVSPMPSPGAVTPGSIRDDVDAHGSIARLFRHRASETPEAPFIHAPREGEGWETWSWQRVEAATRVFAGRLQALGLVPGDRLVLISENRIEWILVHLATLACGGVFAPQYANANCADWERSIAALSPKLVFASTACLGRWPAAQQHAARPLPEPPLPDAPANFDASALDAAQAADAAFIFLTSGTDGEPKFATLSHRNVLWNAVGAAQRMDHYDLQGHRFLSFLPLAHSYEHSAGYIFPMTLGAEIFISRGPEQVRHDMQGARPTVMTCVPRFLHLIEGRIRASAKRVGGLRGKLFDAALATGVKRERGDSLSVGELLAQPFLETLVRRKILAGFGGALRCLLSAGAPLSRETVLFFRALGFHLHQAYGQTEAAPAITMTSGENPKPGSVGRPLTGVEVKLAEDGEVLARGPNIMLRYWGETSSPVDKQGWLATGDIGYFDDDGDLWIVDRKRDIIKTAGGEMFTPALVEAALQASGAISGAYVMLNDKGHCIALITPSDAATDGDIVGAVERVNAGLPAWARIRSTHTIPAATVAGGLLTPTLKSRRKKIFNQHCHLLSQRTGTE